MPRSLHHCPDLILELGGGPRFLLPGSPRPRVPHPCVLCKGGYHGRESGLVEIELRNRCSPSGKPEDQYGQAQSSRGRHHRTALSGKRKGGAPGSLLLSAKSKGWTTRPLQSHHKGHCDRWQSCADASPGRRTAPELSIGQRDFYHCVLHRDLFGKRRMGVRK